MKSHPGPYAALAAAAHEKREAGRRQERLTQLCRDVADALEKAQPLYRDMRLTQDPDLQQMGKVFARLFDAGVLLMQIQKRNTTA